MNHRLERGTWTGHFAAAEARTDKSLRTVLTNPSTQYPLRPIHAVRDPDDKTALCDREPTMVKGRCLHLELVPVESVAGDLVAHLCLTCDAQLPAEVGATRDVSSPGA